MAEENGTDTDDDDVVTGIGNPRDDYRKQLYDKMDKDVEDSGEMVDIPDDGVLPEPVQSDPEPVQRQPEPQRKTIKVNGQERQVTDEELIELAQKGFSADEKFQQAAEMRRQAEQLAQQASVQAPAATVDDDDRALARALQMGNEDEAAAVIARLRRTPSVTDETVRAIDERLTFLQASERVQTEFQDLTSRPFVWKTFLKEDEEMVKAGDSRGYWARYQDIGARLRKEFNLPTPETVQAQTKLERKANITPIPRANVRNAPVQEDDGPENTSEVIANMAKKRGQYI